MLTNRTAFFTSSICKSRYAQLRLVVWSSLYHLLQCAKQKYFLDDLHMYIQHVTHQLSSLRNNRRSAGLLTDKLHARTCILEDRVICIGRFAPPYKVRAMVGFWRNYRNVVDAQGRDVPDLFLCLPDLHYRILALHQSFQVLDFWFFLRISNDFMAVRYNSYIA